MKVVMYELCTMMVVHRAEELNTMSTGEDEPCSSLNGRLRPRKSTTTNTSTPNQQSKTIRKTEGKLAQDRPKRTSTPSKASPTKQNDLASKSDISSDPLFLCPYCDRTFNARQTGSKHARRIHLSTSKQDNFIKCLYCNHSDADPNAIIKHMVDSHPNQYFACLDCYIRFSTTTELAEHKLNVCEKQKLPYCSKLRKKTSARTKKNTNKKPDTDKKSNNSNENTEYTDDGGFNGIVISCELKPSDMHDAVDIEDKITTNLILPSSKTLGNIGREKNAVIVLDDLQWHKRIPPNFSFHNTDADQILSRLGVVHRSPRVVGESREDLIRLMDEPNEKFEKCFDTTFYTKVAKNVQDNLTKYLDGSFNFNSNKEIAIKTRKTKSSVVINTAEGFPILLAHEQFSRNLFDGFIPRAMAPKHKWKWDTAENDKNIAMLLDQTKRDSHVNNCIVTLISSLDIWTQLRMKSKFEGIFKTTRTVKKTEKQNIISLELKEILESRDIPTTSSQVVQYRGKSPETREGSELPAYLGLSPMATKCQLQPAVLSGEWVRPRCFVCCACGEQTRDARALSTHLSSQHPNAQVQHYEIVGETLLSADIVKHLYVPPSQMSNRTRPPRGFRDCTKCKKSITLEDLHQHMLDCAGDTPTVRRKCRYRPFGVRRRRPRLPDNTMRKKMRKDIRSRHRQKAHMRPRPRVRTEVGDAETIRKMIADLPAKRNRITPSNVLRPRRNIVKAKSKQPVKLRASGDKKSKKSNTLKNLNKPKRTEDTKNQNDSDNDNSSTVDEDDQPLKLSATAKSANSKDTMRYPGPGPKKKSMERNREDPNIRGFPPNYNNYNVPYFPMHADFSIPDLRYSSMLSNNLMPTPILPGKVFRPVPVQPGMYRPLHPYYYNEQHVQHRMSFGQPQQHRLLLEEVERLSLEQLQNHALEQAQHDRSSLEKTQNDRLSSKQTQDDRLSSKQTQHGRMSTEEVSHDLTLWEQAQRDRTLLEKAQHDRLSSKQILRDCISSKRAKRDRILSEKVHHDRISLEEPHHDRILSEEVHHDLISSEQLQYDRISPKVAQHDHERISSDQILPDCNSSKRVQHDQILTEEVHHDCISSEQPHHDRISPEQAQHDRISSEHVQHDLTSSEQNQNNLTSELAERNSQVQAPHIAFEQENEQLYQNQLAMEQSCERIDVHDAESSHIRKRGNCNDNNMDGSKEHPVRGKDDCNQNNNIAQVPNTPLKHSIASLTSHAERRDLAAPYYHAYLFPSESDNNTQMYESSNNRKDFENESSVEKLNKPPLSDNRLDLEKPNQRPLSPIIEPGGEQSSPDESVRSQKPDPKHLLPNDSLEFQESGKQPLLPNNPIRSADHDGKSPLLHFHKKSEEPCKVLLSPNDLIEPLKADGQPPLSNPRKQPIPLDKKYKLKIEASRMKFYKNRRGLKDSIAILKTKKSLDNPTSECGDDETQDSEIIDLETLDDENPVSVDLDPTLIESKSTKENNGTNSIHLTSQILIRSSLPEQCQAESVSEIKTQCDLTDDHNLTPRDDNVCFRKGETSVDSVHGTSNTKQHDAKSESPRTRSLCRTESEVANPRALMQTDHSLRVKQRQASEVNRDNGITTRRNSDSRLLTVENRVVENLLPHHREMKTAKTYIDFNLSDSAQCMHDEQVKITEDKEDTDQKLFQESNQYIAMQKQYSVPESMLIIGREANQETRVDHDTKTIDNTEMSVEQNNVLPASRRTIRKPTKKISISEQQRAFYYERSKSQKEPTDNKTTVLPLHHSAYRNITEESSVHLISSNYLLPATSIEAVPLKAPLDTQVRRESHKRVLNTPETDAGIVHKRNNGSQNKMLKNSLETRVENVNVQNLRRHSIELAQYKPVNYDILMAETYRERCEKAFLNTSPPSRGLPHSRKVTQDDFIKHPLDGNVPYDKSSERHPQYSSFSTYVSTTHDRHETMDSYPKSISNEILNTKTYYEDEQFRKKIQSMSFRKQRSNNSESTIDYMMKRSELENKFIGQERETTLQTSNGSDSRSHNLGIRRSSVDYHIRSSPYQCNVQNINVLNMSDHSLDLVSDENTKAHSNSLRAYHESVASFIVPTVPYSNNIYNPIPPMQCDPNVEDLTPLDLSCDSKVRNETILDCGNRSSEVLKNPCDIQISNESHFDVTSMNVNNQYKYAEQQNLPQHPLLNCYKSPNREYAHESVSLEKSVKLSHEIAMTNREDIMSNQINKHHTALSTEIGQSVNLELSDNSSYESSQRIYGDETSNIVSVVNASNSSDRSSFLPPDCDYILPRQTQFSYPTSIISRQESMQEKTFLENKKIARSSKGNQENQFENKKSSTENNTVLTKSAPLTDGITSNVENVNQYETSSNMGHHTNFLIESIKTNEMNSNNNPMQETTPEDATAQIYNEDVLSQNDHTPIDQDAETARKFAMLPEELVKILGTIPKDHRNQLLNVLPHYVSNPVSTVKTDMTNPAAAVSNKNNVKPQEENKKHTMPSNDNRLSVNTAISPSSIIPKKRHSPSQSRGSLNNSNEILPNPPVLHSSPMPTLFQASSIGRDDNSTNNAQFSQNNSCAQKVDSDNLTLYPTFTEVVTRKSFENDDVYTDLNLVDLQNPDNINKSKELSQSSGIAFFPPLPSQDLPHKIPAKNKHCNEQTASLRAVRIKTTSARKSLSDEKNLLTNYSFKTNISTDEECTNSGQMINPHSHSYKNLTDLQYAKLKMSPQIQKEHNDDMLLQASKAQNANNSHQDDNTSTTPSILYNKLPRVNNEDVMCSLPNCSTFTQSDDKISFETSQSSNQLKKTITLEPSATVTLQNTNMDVDHFLGRMKSTNSPNENKHKNLMSVQQINVFSSYNEEFLNRMSESQFTAGDKIDLSSEWKPSLEVTEITNEINTIEVNQFFPSSNINEKNQTVSSDSTNDQISQLNLKKASQNKTFDNSFASPSECDVDANFLSETLSRKEEKSNEDDSEDDVSLAVIKQKQCCHLSVSETDFNTLEVASKQIQSSAKFDSKEKTYQLKVDSPGRNKEMSKPIEIVHEDNITEDDDDINDVLELSNVELGFNDKDAKLIQTKIINTVSVNITVEDNNRNNNEVSEFDVNKENNITENVSKIKEADLILLPEHDKNGCQVESCFENTTNDEYMDAINAEISIDQHSDDKSIVATKSGQDETYKTASSNFEIFETDSSGTESHLKPKSKTKETLNFYNKNEIECYSPDVESNNESNSSKFNSTNTPSTNELNLTSENLEFNELMEVSHTDSMRTRDNITSNFKKYSDVCETSTLFLRRSRRGKSLYVDNSCLELEDSEQIVQVEDEREANIKTPLTMKRLILSRVERDRKRINESIIFEKCSEAVNDLQLTDCSETILPYIKIGKVTKRKKSPQSKRKPKKIKSSSTNQQEEDSNDAVGNKISMSQVNIPNTKNVIVDEDISKEDVTCCVNPSNIIGSSVDSTIIENEDICEVAGDNLKEIEGAITAPGKRKLNITKVTNSVSSKPKKSKHHKKKSKSDFDSDDEKVLLETKQIIAAEKHSIVDKNSSTISTCEKTLDKEDNASKLLKTSEGSSYDMTKQSTNVSMARMTCYNRPMSNKKSRTSSASLKDHANYDPYDIDFEDMIDTSKPIIKKKSKIVGNIHASKFHYDKKVNMKSKELNSPSIKISKQNTDEIVSNVNNESDSDSSKSDVPLQKYVREKALETEATNTNNEDNINAFDNNKYEEGQVKALHQRSDITQETIVYNTVNTTNEEEKTGSANGNKDVFLSKSKGKKCTKRIKKSYTLCESQTSTKDHNSNTNNNDTVNTISQKRRIKYKKTRRMLAKASVSDEVDQQLRSDKFMENFGFYSEKIPRKSNLLAAKKISETFHMISNESEDSSGCTDESSQKSTQFETKKKFETFTAVSQDTRTNDGTDFITQLTESRMDVDDVKAVIANEPCDVIRTDDSKLDSVTDKKIVESEEVQNLENDLLSGFKEAANANVDQNCYVENQCTHGVEAIVQDAGTNVPILHSEQDFHKTDANPEIIKKSNKNSKTNKQASMKDKMYPDIEEIDMFEDKFDKIKRKRRSQAVAAKQVQHVVETNISAKSRKQTEKKRSRKNTKKNNPSTQVLTKGALKGYEGIKISISTQDLIMPPTLSPPRQQKKRKKINVKRRKVVSDSESSCSEYDNREKTSLEKDIYEFKESEDTELFELRPSTVMDRFRSMHNKSKFKNKEKDKVNRDIEKQKQRTTEKEKKAEAKEKELVNTEKDKTKDRRLKCPDDENRQKKSVPQDEGQCKDKEIQKELNYVPEQSHLNEKSGARNESINTLDYDTCTKKQKCHDDEDNNKKVADGAIAGTSGTSGFVPDRMDESDYESEISSPGQFIFYASEDVNCVCPSDNDSDESDIEKGCGRLNCIYKNRNADKNAAIGNIFKNNAVRCDKTDAKEPEKLRPDLDQLFDSLFETNPIVNSEILDSQKEVVPEHTEQALSVSTAVDDEVKNRASTSTVLHHDLIASEPRDHSVTPNKEKYSTINESFSTATLNDPLWTKNKQEHKKTKINKNVVSKNETVSSQSFNEIMSDSDSIQIFNIESKPKDNLGYSLVSEECTQVNFEDIIADEMTIKNDATKSLEVTVKTSDQLAKYNSEDEFDIDKPESLNRQYMHLVLPADKASSCAQTEHKSDNSDTESSNESVITKYLKELSTSEASKLEIYTMVSAQGTQTGQPNTPHEDDTSKHGDLSPSIKYTNRIVLRSCIRLQKFDIHEISKKSVLSKCIQTDKSTSCKTAQRDTQTESDDDNQTGKSIASKELDSVKGTANNNNNCSNIFFNEEIDVSSPKDGDSFATPASKSTSDKHSPRKSDEGISTSHDYSADAFDQASFDDTGVARQRARRKCTVGKQNVLAEHWSSESEFDGLPPRPNSADSVVASAGRKKKNRKKEGQHSGRRGSRHASKNESRGSARRRAESGGRSDDSDVCAGPSRAPPGPKIRARPAHHYWSSDGEETSGPQPQHGWIVGDSHKKLVTMLAHAKGRKRNSSDKQHLLD